MHVYESRGFEVMTLSDLTLDRYVAVYDQVQE